MKLEVLDPVGVPDQRPGGLAERHPRLDGRVLWFLDGHGDSSDGAIVMNKVFAAWRKLLETDHSFSRVHWLTSHNIAVPFRHGKDTFERVVESRGAVVNGVALCGGCTSCAIYDAVQLEAAGIPTITLVHDTFESAARAHANLLGMPDLPLAVIAAQTYYTGSTEEIKAFAERTYSALIRALTGNAPANSGGSNRPATAPSRASFDAVVVGAGPAGLTAVTELSRLGVKAMLVDSRGLGGEAANVHELVGYGTPGATPVSGWELVDSLSAGVQKSGVTLLLGSVDDISPVGDRWRIDVGGQAIHAGAVVIATGTRPARLLDGNVEHLVGSGLSYCATCDGRFFREQRVVVIGSGDFAVSEAHYLAQYAAEVLVVFEEGSLRASPAYIELLRGKTNVSYHPDTKVEALLVQGPSVSGIRCRAVSTGVPVDLSLTGVFVSIGRQPNTDAPWRQHLDLDPDGYIRADVTGATALHGLFAAGDVCSGAPQTVAHAIEDGRRVAGAVSQCLRTRVSVRAT